MFICRLIAAANEVLIAVSRNIVRKLMLQSVGCGNIGSIGHAKEFTAGIESIYTGKWC